MRLVVIRVEDLSYRTDKRQIGLREFEIRSQRSRFLTVFDGLSEHAFQAVRGTA